jgi:O-acetyl-ADP-ribose deacetylase (regulator of RNase III)
MTHVVGPVHRKTDAEELQRRSGLLVSCYTNALRVAGGLRDEDGRGVRTIAFPLVSAGVYGWPLDDAIRVAVETLRSTPTRVQEARIVAFGRATYDAVRSAL